MPSIPSTGAFTPVTSASLRKMLSCPVVSVLEVDRIVKELARRTVKW